MLIHHARLFDQRRAFGIFEQSSTKYCTLSIVDLPTLNEKSPTTKVVPFHSEAGLPDSRTHLLNSWLAAAARRIFSLRRAARDQNRPRAVHPPLARGRPEDAVRTLGDDYGLTLHQARYLTLAP